MKGARCFDGRGRPSFHRLVLRCFYGFDHDELAHLAAVFEDDAAGDFGEERVVFAAAYIEAGFHAGAALADDDGAAGDDLSAECFEAEALRVRVAAVSGCALSFFM